MELWHRHVSVVERRNLAKTGAALPDGSFPIAKVADVQPAIKLAKTDKQRAHVIKRAKALGVSHKLPPHWNTDGTIKHAESADDVLEHHGIKGMKWGVRRTDAQLAVDAANKGKPGGGVSKSKTDGTATQDAKTANTLHIRAQIHGPASLSNQEMQALVTRMNLEQQYSRLASQTQQTGAGKKFVKDLLVNVAKQQLTALANEQAKKQIGKLAVAAATGGK